MPTLKIRTQNIIDICVHVTVTMILSIVILGSTRNILYVAFIIAGGILVDLDHLIDYHACYGRRFYLPEFLNTRYLVKTGKVYLVLHSWELNFLVLCAALFANSLGLLLFFASFTLHLIIDNVQRRNPWFYLLSYRWVKGFNTFVLLPELQKETAT